MTPHGYDLHVHSIHSDGIYSPLQLLELARRGGLAGIAIADHDVLPCPDAMTAAPVQGPIWLAAIELSCAMNGRGIHLLGYGFDSTNRPLQSMVESVQTARRQRFARLVECLGMKATAPLREKLDRLSQLRSPGRRHLARCLVEHRRASCLRDAFARYLKPLEGVAEFERPQLRDAVRALHDAGGVAVVAHPPGHWDDDCWRTLVDAGMDGIETRFPAATGNRRRRLEAVASAFGLQTTGGSDFHGDGPAEFIGRCQSAEPPRAHWSERAA